MTQSQIIKQGYENALKNSIEHFHAFISSTGENCKREYFESYLYWLDSLNDWKKMAKIIQVDL